MPIESLVVVLVKWFIWKTLLEINANESLLMNISYIELSCQYFLINIVLSCSSNLKYKGAVWLHLENEWYWVWSLIEWSVYPFRFVLVDIIFASIAYTPWVIYCIPLLTDKFIYYAALYIEKFGFAVPWWAKGGRGEGSRGFEMSQYCGLLILNWPCWGVLI